MLSLLAAAWAAPAAAPKPSDPWQTTLEAVTPAVVQIQFQSPRFFDTETAFDAVATGFVVDKERGIILTNRHVVNPGPVVAEAIFLDHEAVPIQAIYRDPVHDFGFYRFDPKALRHMQPAELPLAPDGATVGTEIRVVGNDAGEKLSILAGTLARVDRDAPAYGPDDFNDSNTFYIQAASSTSGGSSGSPVVDVHGRAIALNAGGSNFAASSFYLPLDRVVRALDRVRGGTPVTRGTLQTIFVHRDFDALERLGLRPETEDAVRRRDGTETGMLLVDDVVPGGPADGKLQVGDILVALDGKPLTTFLPLEARLDDGVGQTVTLSVERGGKPLDVPLTVQDLHTITPAEYLEMGDGILNPLSFMQARNHHVPAGGAYVAFPGYVLGNGGVPRGAWLKSVNGVATPTLAAAEAAFAALADGEEAQVRYVDVHDVGHEDVAVIQMNRRLFRMDHCRRDDTTGWWPCTDSPAPPPPVAQEPAAAVLPQVIGKAADTASKSLVYVECVLPFRIQGAPSDSYSGVGVVVDAEQGLVLVDRNTVPVALAEVHLIVGGQVRVPAKVRWIDPNHNIAVVQYDPALLAGTPLRGVTLATRPLKSNDSLLQVGLNNRLKVTWASAHVSGTRPFILNIPSTPSFRDHDLEVLETSEAALDRGGILVDRKGRMAAWWASFGVGWGDQFDESWFAVPSDVLADVLTPLREGRTPDTRTLGVEWEPLTLADARRRGLPDAEAIWYAGPGQILVATHVAADAPAAGVVHTGDMLLGVDGHRATTFREVELAGRSDAVALRVWREDKAETLEVKTRALPGDGPSKVFLWAGAVLHDVDSPVALQHNLKPEGAYVAWAWFGSPADHDNLRGTWRVIAVDDLPTPDLAAFEKAVAGRPDRSTVRLHIQDLDGRDQLISLRLDLHYWPSAELVLENGSWVRKPG